MTKTLIRMAPALVAIVLVANGSVAAGTLKGRWTITISPDERASLTTDFKFSKGGKGKGGNAFTGGALAYREDDSGFSATWEFDGPIIPQASIPGPATIVLRGTADGDAEIHGEVLIITDERDAASSTGYVTLHGTFVGVKQR